MLLWRRGFQRRHLKVLLQIYTLVVPRVRIWFNLFVCQSDFGVGVYVRVVRLAQSESWWHSGIVLEGLTERRVEWKGARTCCDGQYCLR